MVIVALITLNDTYPHTKTLGRSPLHEESACHNIERGKHPQTRLESNPQYKEDLRAATGIGTQLCLAYL